MTIEEKFEELISGLTRKLDFEQNPEYISFLRGNEFMFSYNFNSGHLWCHREKVWGDWNAKGNIADTKFNCL